MRVRLYRDATGEWRWSVIAANGRIVADSAEGYESRDDAEAMMRRVTNLAPAGLDIIVEED